MSIFNQFETTLSNLPGILFSGLLRFGFTVSFMVVTTSLVVYLLW